MKLLNSLPPYNFCGTEKEFKDCPVAILQVPYDATASYGAGARFGPHAIVCASRNMELYDDETDSVPADVGIFTIDELEPSMKSPEDNCSRVESAVSEILENKKFPIIFGGDHSVSIGSARAMKKAYPDLTILHIDAHADLRDEFESTKYSHACAARRFSESCPVTQFGIRSFSEEESEFMKLGKVKTFSIQTIRRHGLEAAINGAIQSLSGSVYISLDIDAIDPSEVPATGTPEPGGLHYSEVISLLKQVCERKKVVGFDLVELAPIPGQTMSDFLAAKVVYKLLAYKFANKRQ